MKLLGANLCTGGEVVGDEIYGGEIVGDELVTGLSGAKLSGGEIARGEVSYNHQFNLLLLLDATLHRLADCSWHHH